MKKRSILRRKSKPISKPAPKFLWMIRNRRGPSLSSRRSSSALDGCGAALSGHEDILVEILARLPVKSLMRFRCVCTTWRSLISAPHFLKKQMKYDAVRALNDTDDVRLLFDMKPPSSIGLTDLKTSNSAQLDLKRPRQPRVPVRELEFPVCLDFVQGVSSIGAANGIVCVHFRDEYVLWNPCTGEHNVLPKPRRAGVDRGYFGFGYDPISDDYKVVTGTRMGDGLGYDMIHGMMQVFSLRRGTWNAYPGSKSIHVRGQGVCVNGVMHWLSESREVMPFSLAEEKFLEAMSLPSDFGGIFASGGHGIFVSGGRLCVYDGWGKVKIMTMKEYGVKESWTDVLNITYHTVPEIYDEICSVKPIWILENGDVVARTVQHGPFLSVYKSKENAFGHVIQIDGGGHFYEYVTYRETLVSPITGSLKDI